MVGRAIVSLLTPMPLLKVFCPDAKAVAPAAESVTLLLVEDVSESPTMGNC
ncbi:hypothetical protein D3C85_1804070 [compost metagenome]